MTSPDGPPPELDGGLRDGLLVLADGSAFEGELIGAETGIATGMNTVVRTLGSVIGAQVAITLVAGNLIPGTAIPAEGGFVTSLWLGGAAALIGALIALGIPSGRRRVRVATVAGDA